MPGRWTIVSTEPDFGYGTMLLLTDGSVLCHQSSTPNWKKLTPDPAAANPSAGYVNGKWSAIASMPHNSAIPPAKGGPAYAPLYFYSAILRDGRVIVAGGECNGPVENAEVASAQIYDPVSNQWQIVSLPGGAQPWDRIGDAPGCVLPDGRVLLGDPFHAQASIFDPTSGQWTDAAPTQAKNDACAEETWTLLANDSVLVAECVSHDAAERYILSSDSWVNDGPTDGDLVEATSLEIGPAILLPDGRVFALGATGITNLYSSGASATTPGTWVRGPDIPLDPNKHGAAPQLIAKDSPAALLPNGRVLFTAGPASANCPAKSDGEGYCGPTFFFEFDPNTSAIVPILPPWQTKAGPYCGRMLLLPTGDVLFTSAENQLAIYTPDGFADAKWAPQITGAPGSVKAGSVECVTGQQFNGLSQAVAYGDDASMATNYPIVTLTQPTTGRVVFARSYAFSTMAVATGTRPVSTLFRVSADTVPGPYDLRVTANGISSTPKRIVVTP